MKMFLMVLAAAAAVITGLFCFANNFKTVEIQLMESRIGEIQSLYNEQKFQEIYYLIHPSRRRAMSSERLSSRFRETFDKYGTIRSASQIKGTLLHKKAPMRMYLTYSVEFERGTGEMTYGFEYYPENDEVRLFTIDPPRER